jgi:mono/diheme cytochrome c family protein
MTWSGEAHAEVAARAVGDGPCSRDGRPGRVQPRVLGTQEQVARGEELYQANCAACHGGAIGGDIADIPPPHNAEGHTWHHEDCLLLEIVQDGMPRRPGLPEDAPTMPAFGDELSEEDIRAMLAFIKTWWTEDQLEFQQQVTEQACD